MADPPFEDPSPRDRRQFFVAGFGRLLRPLADYLERKLPLSMGRTFLRPPGARLEHEFLNTCFRCGACADACPAHCITLMQSDDERLRGTPTIDPDLAACVVCDELACMKACPSGALRLVDRFGIRMGLARVRLSLCVRTAGEDCRICVEKCPFGDGAIRIGADGRVDVRDPSLNGERGCVGCGVCQFHCPTRPKAIVVEAD